MALRPVSDSEIMRCGRCKQEVEVFQVPRFLEPETYICGLCLTPKKDHVWMKPLPLDEDELGTQTRLQVWT